jgi:dethiobiotin synthetase
MQSNLPKLPTMTRFFIAGTDTEIGKTYAACTLIHALRRARPQARVAAMKPIAAGTDEHGRNDDVERLKAAANVALPAEVMTPYLFAPAIAPHVAAAEAGVRIDIAKVLQNFAAIAAVADHVVVEGVGGFRVPLDAETDTADLAVALGLPVILVVGIRLGCLSHALLSAEAIQARGLSLAGWIANCVDPAMARPQASVDTLRSRLTAPLLGILPFDAGRQPARAACRLEAAINALILP